MPDIVLLRVGSDALVQFDWTDLPTGVSLQSVAHTVPAPMVKGQEQTYPSQSASTVRVDTNTAKHGEIYTIDALATLQNGEKVPASIVVQIWNE